MFVLTNTTTVKKCLYWQDFCLFTMRYYGFLYFYTVMKQSASIVRIHASKSSTIETSTDLMVTDLTYFAVVTWKKFPGLHDFTFFDNDTQQYHLWICTRFSPCCFYTASNQTVSSWRCQSMETRVKRVTEWLLYTGHFTRIRCTIDYTVSPGNVVPVWQEKGHAPK